jgi:hypothetical protein
MHIAFVGNHQPPAIARRLQIDNTGETINLRTVDAGGFGKGVGHSRRIDVSFDRIVQRTDEAAFVEQGKKPPRFVHVHELGLHAEVAAPRVHEAQPVHAFGGPGQHQAARDVDAAGLAGDLLDLLVQVDRVLLELCDVRVAVDGVHAASRMPGGARS